MAKRNVTFTWCTETFTLYSRLAACSSMFPAQEPSCACVMGVLRYNGTEKCPQPPWAQNAIRLRPLICTPDGMLAAHLVQPRAVGVEQLFVLHESRKNVGICLHQMILFDMKHLLMACVCAAAQNAVQEEIDATVSLANCTRPTCTWSSTSRRSCAWSPSRPNS